MRRTTLAGKSDKTNPYASIDRPIGACSPLDCARGISLSLDRSPHLWISILVHSSASNQLLVLAATIDLDRHPTLLLDGRQQFDALVD